MIKDKLTQAVAEAYKKMKQEELKGDQHKIDANKNGEIDAHDFHLLRKQKNEETEPKSEKEKNLAALGHPKDKITHKDVLIGRGVLKKEETEKETEYERNVKKTKETFPNVKHFTAAGHPDWKKHGYKDYPTKNESWDSKKSAVSEQRLEEGKQKFSNSKLQELVAKLSHHVRQLDAAGSRGEYSVSSNLLEQAADAIQGMMQHKKQKLSNSKLLELITKCRARARQLDSAGSRGEYSVTSGLLEQAANAIQAMMQDKKITEANDELIEGIFSTKKSRIHKSIGQHVDDHLEGMAKGKSSEPLRKALPEIHKKIADAHGISHDEAKKHVASYIEKKSDDIYWRNRDAVAPGHPGAGAGY